MAKRMLIDATHKEEVRVAIIDGNKLIEYDYESQSRKPLKGSIFLAKVTRVEPSLQAAFVNFGGNRHGFLPFSEIHPDYFKIPVADREALMAEQEALLQEHDEENDDDENDSDENDSDENDETEETIKAEEISSNIGDIVDDMETTANNSSDPDKSALNDNDDDDDVVVDDGDNNKDENNEPVDIKEEPRDNENKQQNDLEESGQSEDALENGAQDEQENEQEEQQNRKSERRRTGYRGRNGRGRGNRNSQYRNRNVEVVGGSDDIDDEQRFRFNLRRRYKIQEVIKRGQIMLVQANKEERGNKGAALGSYLSLPGRYCVLMPNSPRGGGVSRKIANSKDRARMREIVKELDVPKGMSVIVRTAGVTRTKAEIKRDLDYLMRLWNNIRELTLQSTAPALIYEEADLIRRAIRDLYTRDIEEIYVAGEEGYKTARDFMKMMIPSHVKKVKFYDDKKLPLFNRYQIESQINEIGRPDVRLKSGGYLVINPTEALVSIDVNSGKATKGRHIEETALKTNLEAADEVARQLKLRDLGGLVVIDFIDMENRSNNAKVERRMKEALSDDRARVQVGRISSFGLMELSRQRLSPSLMEAQFEQCNNCSGIGLIRTADAMSIIVLRAIEDEGIRGRAAQLIVQVTGKVALYILNHKRRKLAQIEERYDLEVLLRINDDIPASEYIIEVSKPAKKNTDNGEEDTKNNPEDDIIPEDGEDKGKDEDKDKKEKNNNRGRRRGRRGGRNRNNNGNNNDNAVENAGDKNDNISDGNDGADEKPLTDADNTDDDAVDSEKAQKDKSRKTVRKKKQTSVSTDPANDDNIDKDKDKDIDDKLTVAEEEKPSSKASEYETVNQAPKQKKKGWWNRL